MLINTRIVTENYAKKTGVRGLEARHTAHFLGTGTIRWQCRPGGSSVEDLHRNTPGLNTLATPPSTLTFFAGAPQAADRPVVLLRFINAPRAPSLLKGPPAFRLLGLAGAHAGPVSGTYNL